MKNKTRLKTILLAASIFLTTLALVSCGSNEQKLPFAQQPPKTEINVSAAVSLKEALGEIAEKYRTKNPNTKIIFNFGASGTLQKQIEQGAPADMFVSAAPKQMNELEAKNLIKKETRQNLVKNELVLIVPAISSLNPGKYEDIEKKEVEKFAMGEPEVVPAGQYAKQVLTKIGIWDKVKGKAIQGKDVRTVLAYVETGNVAAGIVYKTDAVASGNKVKIAAAAPPLSHEPIVYPIAILTEAKDVKATEDFYKFILSPESKPVWEKSGFTPVK